MASRVVTLAPPTLRGRFEAAAGGEPLSDLAAGPRKELESVLARAEAFEDLPGKWQAALLQAEGARAGGGWCH